MKKEKSPMKTTPLRPFGILVELESGTPCTELLREDLLALIERHKLVLVRGHAPIKEQDLLRLTALDVKRDLLGPVLEKPSQAGAVPLHWEGAFELEPRVLAFHCLSAPSAGGQAIFSDAEAVWSDASRETRNAWKKILLTYEAGDGRLSTNTLAQYHPDKPVTIVRFAEPVSGEVNPVLKEVEGIRGERAEFLEEMSSLLNSKKYLYEHEWRENDLLLADNFSVLHGKRALPPSARCQLRKVQIR